MAATAVKMAWRTEPGGRAILEIDVPEDEMARAMDRAYAALAQRVTVPGFRRGKAPRAVLERHVGTEALREEALKTLLPERYAQAIEQAGLSPLTRPSFEVAEGADGKGVRLTATVEVLPQVNLPEYRTLRVSRDAHPVTDADVDRVLERGERLMIRRESAARHECHILFSVISDRHQDGDRTRRMARRKHHGHRRVAQCQRLAVRDGHVAHRQFPVPLR